VVAVRPAKQADNGCRAFTANKPPEISVRLVSRWCAGTRGRLRRPGDRSGDAAHRTWYAQRKSLCLCGPFRLRGLRARRV